MLRIIRERYAEFGPTLACRKLSEVHGLHLAKETGSYPVDDKTRSVQIPALPNSS
jgi:hypothetical protein